MCESGGLCQPNQNDFVPRYINAIAGLLPLLRNQACGPHLVLVRVPPPKLDFVTSIHKPLVKTCDSLGGEAEFAQASPLTVEPRSSTQLITSSQVWAGEGKRARAMMNPLLRDRLNSGL